MTTEAQNAKKALRKDIKAKLSSLSDDDISKQSEIAQNLVLNLPQYQEAKSLSIYLSMPASEAQTSSLVRCALGSGKKVFVPFLYAPAAANGEGKKRKRMDMLQLNSAREYEGLEKDAWGIPSLSAKGVEQKENAMGGVGLTLAASQSAEGKDGGGLDVVIVPGVAFDGEGKRLGHGAGFYDSFLTRFCDGGRRSKPYLGAYPNCTRPSQAPADPECSWPLPGRTVPRVGAADPDRAMGLEHGCYRHG